MVKRTRALFKLSRHRRGIGAVTSGLHAGRAVQPFHPCGYYVGNEVAHFVYLS
jgi:hypothetical protein